MPMCVRERKKEGEGEGERKRDKKTDRKTNEIQEQVFRPEKERELQNCSLISAILPLIPTSKLKNKIIFGILARGQDS